MDIVFFAEVDDTIDAANKPLRIGCGTCGEELSQRSGQYWSSVTPPPLRKIWSEGPLHAYRYVGYSDTLLLYSLDGARVEEVSEGWAVLEQDGESAVLVSTDDSGEVEFTLHGEFGWDTTGLLCWQDGSDGVSHGFVFGPGTAQYALLHPTVLAREPGWPRLLQGLSLALLLIVLLIIVLRVQRARKRWSK